MDSFIPNSIRNIILYYLNPHELYLEELKNKTIYIYQIVNSDSIIDHSYTKEFVVTNFKGIWEIGLINGKKLDTAYYLYLRMSYSRWSQTKASNKCHISY